MEVKAYAKINLFLDIESKRTDGYHNIKSVMQQVDWCDTLNFDRLPAAEGIELTGKDLSPELKKDNIILKACRAFMDYTKQAFGLKIRLDKHIPVSAGMAGGSADAAATLAALNEISPVKIQKEELIKLGAGLGADIPFCLTGGTQLITGIGDVRTVLPPWEQGYILCAKLGEGFSTPLGYRMLDEAHDQFVQYAGHDDQLKLLVSVLEKGSVALNPACLYNVFEEIVEPLRQDVTRLKEAMISCGAYAAMMSGSGTSVFGLFEEKSAADAAFLRAVSIGAACRVCRPVSISLI